MGLPLDSGSRMRVASIELDSIMLCRGRGCDITNLIKLVDIAAVTVVYPMLSFSLEDLPCVRAVASLMSTSAHSVTYILYLVFHIHAAEMLLQAYILYHVTGQVNC